MSRLDVQVRRIGPRPVTIQNVGSQEEFERSLEIVGPGFGGDIDETARFATELGAGSCRDQFHFPDRLQVDVDRVRAAERIVDVDPINGGQHIPVPGAKDIHVAVTVGIVHPRSEDQDVAVIPSHHRQALDEGGIE